LVKVLLIICREQLDLQVHGEELVTATRESSQSGSPREVELEKEEEQKCSQESNLSEPTFQPLTFNLDLGEFLLLYFKIAMTDLTEDSEFT
jgi:hypothetical protein